jgi:Mg-chelatase subunit ChlD
MDTHVTFVLDSSGSMSKIEDDTKGGFNVFLQEQQEEEGTATVTLYDFDSTVELVYRNRPIADAPKLDNENYRPGGKTALHDAIVRAVDETAEQIETTAPRDQPENVIIVVLTDGKENASETPQDVVRDRVEERREESGWEFLFIGANQDAALTAQEMGMDQDKSLDMSHSGEGAEEAYRSTSRSVSRARQQGSTGGYTEEDRQRQRDADES